MHRTRVQDSQRAVQEVGKETCEEMANKFLMLKDCKALPYLDHKKKGWIFEVKNQMMEDDMMSLIQIHMDIEFSSQHSKNRLQNTIYQVWKKDRKG